MVTGRARQGFFGRVDDEISFASLLRHTQSTEGNADILRAEAQEAADTQNHSRDMTIFVQKNIIDFADRVIGRIIDILLEYSVTLKESPGTTVANSTPLATDVIGLEASGAGVTGVTGWVVSGDGGAGWVASGIG